VELTSLETILGGGALATASSFITAWIGSRHKKSNGNGNGHGPAKLDTAIFVRYEAAHDHFHTEEAKLAEERVTNIYKKIDGLSSDMNRRLGRIENILDRRQDNVGDPARGRRSAD